MKHATSFSAVFSCVLLTSTALAQDATFAGGVVNIQSVTRTSGVSINLQVRQTFEADEPIYIGTGGPGGSASVIAGSFQNDETIFTLRSEQLFPISYEATAGISAGALNCSNPQDICYGCVSQNFSGPLRFLGDGLQNVDPNNRAYSVTTRFSVSASSNNPAPRYLGPTFKRLQVGTFNDIDLTPYIDFGGKPYHCELKPASFRNGLIQNPQTTSHAMQISEDCRLRWNTEAGIVGSKYAFQMRIIAENEAPRPVFAPPSWSGCFPTTEVDFLVEIGCSEEDLQTGNPSCFLCSDQSLTPIYVKIAEDTEAWTGISRRINSIARRLTRQCNASGFAQRATKKWGKVARQRTRKANEKLATTTVSASSTAGVCLAPSPFFCSSSSLVETKEEFRSTILELSPPTRRVARNSRAVENEIQSCLSKRDKKRLQNLRRKDGTMLNTVLDTINLLPDDSMSCTGPL